MKKSELIEALQKIPGDDYVYIYDWESDLLKRIEVAVKEYPHYIGKEIVEKDILSEDFVTLDHFDIDLNIDLTLSKIPVDSDDFVCYNKYKYDLDGKIYRTAKLQLQYCRPIIVIGDSLEDSEITNNKRRYAGEDEVYRQQLEEEEKESSQSDEDPEYIEYLRLKEKFSNV